MQLNEQATINQRLSQIRSQPKVDLLDDDEENFDQYREEPFGSKKYS